MVLSIPHSINMIQVCFKLCYTSQTINYTVPGDWSVEQFYFKMIHDLGRDLNIKGFCIVPGPELQHESYSGCPEDYPPILLDDTETVEEYCNPNETNMFYVRLFE